MNELSVSTADYLEYVRNVVGQLNAQAVPAMQPNTYVELDPRESWLAVFNSQLRNIAAKVFRTYQRTLRKYFRNQKHQSQQAQLAVLSPRSDRLPQAVCTALDDLR